METGGRGMALGMPGVIPGLRLDERAPVRAISGMSLRKMSAAKKQFAVTGATCKSHCPGSEELRGATISWFVRGYKQHQ